MKKKVAAVLASICLLFVLAACGSSDSNTTDTTPPTVAEIFDKASQENSAKSSSVTGTLSGEVKDEGSTQSADFTFSAEADLENQETDPKVKMTLNDKYEIIVDGQDMYVTANDSSVKIDQNAINNISGGQAPVQNYADAYKAQQDLINSLKPDLEAASTVESGPEVDGKSTWVVNVDLSKVDYKKVIDAYKQTVLEGIQAQADNPQVQKYSEQIVDQMFSGLDQQDFDKVKEVAKLIQFDIMFYADEGWLAGTKMSADITGQDLYDAGVMNDKEELDDSLKGELSTEITYSDSAADITPPADAPNLGTKEGVEALGKAVPSLAPIFSMQQDSAQNAS